MWCFAFFQTVCILMSANDKVGPSLNDIDWPWRLMIAPIMLNAVLQRRSVPRADSRPVFPSVTNSWTDRHTGHLNDDIRHCIVAIRRVLLQPGAPCSDRRAILRTKVVLQCFAQRFCCNGRVSLVRGSIVSCCLVFRSACLQRKDWPGRAHTHEGHILAAYF